MEYLIIISAIVLLGAMYKMSKFEYTPVDRVMYRYRNVMLSSGSGLIAGLLGWMV